MYDHDYDAVRNFAEAFTCATCKKGYKHYRSLRQHVKQVHPNEQIELAPPLKNAKTYEYKCEQCPRQFSDVYNLRSHKRKVHGNQSDDLVSKEGIHKCVMCKKGYIHYRTLRQHVKKVHPDRQFELAPPLKDAKTYQYKCELCPRQFSDVYNLRSHKRKVHGNQCDDLAPKHEVLHKCVMCSHKATKREILIHFEEVHDVKLDIIKVEFDTYDHFIQWKEEFEKETKSKFVKERGDLITKCNTKRSFVCHRSGHYVSKGTGERHLKMQGSNKIDGFCPAKIDVTLVNSKCSIEVTTSHVGHADEIDHPFLPPQAVRNGIDHPFLTASEHNSIAAASTGPSSLDERKASIKRKFIDAIDKLLINEQVDVLENMHTTLGPTLEAVYNSVSKSPEFTNAHTSISHEDIQPQRKLFSPKKAKRKPKTVIAKPTEVESHEIALPLTAHDGNING